MGKNHRHQKKVKAEKSKIQIKTSKTKFLPKGLNVTNTTFKIKPIIIQEQLRDKESSAHQLIGRKKHTIPELVAKLKHHNDNMKIEACDDLIDLIKHNSIDILHKYFSIIIQTISNLIQDRERKVRRITIKLFGDILQQTTYEKFEPFFNFLSTNLRCAMTHIDRNIQEDSLLLLDSLLIHLPELVRKDSTKLFPDFLTLISKLRNDSTTERTLTVNLGSKLTSVRWRIKVLSRLYGILKAIINRDGFDTDANVNRVNCTSFNDSYFLPIYYKDCDWFETNFMDVLEGSQQTTPGGGGSNVLQMYIGTLVPLLYETWLEVVPEKQLKRNTNDVTVLNEESAAILSCIVNILHLLYQYSGQHQHEQIFPPKETEQFFDYLLQNFPYGQIKNRNNHDNNAISRDISKVFQIKDDTKCVEENLLICYEFVVLKLTTNSSVKDYKEKITTITDYLNKYLLNFNHTNPSNYQLLLTILNDLLLVNSKFWRRYHVNIIEIMENLIGFYQKLPIDYHCGIIKLLTSSQLFLRSDIYQKWLQQLPALLCKTTISMEIIDIILQLSRQNCGLIQTGLIDKFEEILGNLPHIRIMPSSDSFIKNKIVYIFFYLTNMDGKHIELLQQFIQNHPDLDYSQYFANMLEIRDVLKLL